jgi:deazaflavin-dependent oxidoreductase (nitroreductase family)
MTAVTSQAASNTPAPTRSARKPRFWGILWRFSRATHRIALPLAGRRWNPIFAVIQHRGRRSGLERATPVAARRVIDGFVVSLAFGARVDWHRNLLAAGGGVMRWRGRAYPVGTPQLVEPAAALPAFNPAQRLLLRVGRIDGFIRLPDRPA